MAGFRAQVRLPLLSARIKLKNQLRPCEEQLAAGAASIKYGVVAALKL
jgi:hypothetical protein